MSLAFTLGGCVSDVEGFDDGRAAFVDPSFNRAPEISGTPPTGVRVNDTYMFEPRATDADNDALAFSVAGLPGWATFNGSTGRLTGTPDDADVGVYTDIQVSVTDGVAKADLAPFSITVSSVLAPNSPPVISGSPRTDVNAGNVYTFTPTATDVDNDALVFSISQMPLWATFDERTGRLSGTPGVADIGTYSNIMISVTDGEFTATLPEFSITVALASSPNTPPVISGTPPGDVDANSAYSFTPTATDADGDMLVFAVSGLPGWASFDDTTGRISGTPADADIGVYSNIQLSVSDGVATADLAPFSIVVNAVVVLNSPPVISGTPPTSVDAGSAYSFTPTASDVDGDTLMFSASGLPVWASFSGATGRVSGTPDESDVGDYPNIQVSVSDGTETASLAPFSITVNAAAPSNTPPVISGSPQTSIDANSAYAFTPTASDADGDSLTFSVSGLPSWAGFNDATGQLSGTPGDTDVGVYPNIRISVTDGSATTNLAPFSIAVNAVSPTNSPPVISGTPQSDVDANSPYSFTPTASDADGDTLTFSVSALPDWASFSNSTGAITGTPGNADAGVYPNIRMSVTDGSASADLAPFSITVNPVVPPNTPPVISGAPATSVDANSAYSFTPTASDADGDVLTFSITGLPSWASFNSSTGQINGTPGNGDVGVYGNIRISVSDGTASANLAAFAIAVIATNSRPVISGSPPPSVQANSPYAFTPTASDADGDTLTFSVQGLPGWANFNSSTGRIGGTPGDADVGVHGNIRISVSDGTVSANLAPFSITVIAANAPPVISGSPPASVQANSPYSFTPTASDADGDTLTFSVQGLPGWANFNSSSGRISGTPGNSDVGIHGNIRISVSDGTATANLAAFSITVTAVNSPPVISGAPSTSVDANTAYSFTPTASDPDGDTLTFSVTGLPGWANFNSATGRISGTPGDANVGVYSNIRISVSDGTATANLAPFSITVNAISLGSVTLTWTAPTQNEDGSPLLDLDRYRIYWGTEPGNYPNSVTIDANVTTYVIEDLPAGTYEFVATSINSDGVESVFSNATVKTIFE